MGIVKPRACERTNGRLFLRAMMRALACFLALGLAGCAADEKKDTNTGANPTASNDTGGSQPKMAEVDRSRCDSNGKKVIELDINKDGKPDVWKYYASALENGAKIDVLTCKEADLNHDGKKDIWTYYDNSGNITMEEFSGHWDGQIDHRVYYQNGKKIRAEMDVNFDGKPDIWKYYENDKLVRLERSSNNNGKVDVWEYYEGGKLDRIGYDDNGSGQINRWDRAPEEATQNASAAPTVKPDPGQSAQPAPAPAPKKQQ